MINRILTYSLIASMLVIAFMYMRITHLASKAEQGREFEGLYKSSVEETKQWKDKHDHWHNQAQELFVSNATLKEMVKAKDPDVVRILSEVKDLKKNLSNLQSFNVVATNTESQFKVKLEDTAIANKGPAKYFDYKTRWDHYRGIVSDSVFIIRQGSDTLDISVLWTRKWFLGKKNYLSEVISANPDTKIEYNRAIEVKRKRK
jgi:hypothetical protein